MTAKSNKIMLVDDDPDFLEQHRIALEAGGWDVLTAGSVAEALTLAQTADLAAAVLDVIMETPDAGFALARQLREHPRFKKLPIILLSSINHVNEEQGVGFRFTDRDRDDTWLPIDKFLDKPVNPREFLRIIRELTKDQ